MKKDKKYLEALEQTEFLYGGLKGVSKRSNKPSKHIVQLVTRLLRHMHGKYFKVVPSIAAETLANECGLSFVNSYYNTSYNIANRMNKIGPNANVSKLFHREHIEGGCKRISTHLLINIDQFNSPAELLDWMYKNTYVVLRLTSEANLIHEESSLSDVEQLIAK